jgi:chemotaxis protein MotB
LAVKRKKPDPPAGAPAWMMTYGDLVTQMLTFFILLFTFSSLDTIKFRDAVISLQGAFGVLSGGTQILNLSDMPTSAPISQEAAPKSSPTLVQVKNLLDDMIKEDEENKQQENQDESENKDQEKEPLITTILDERGLRIRFTDPVLFDLGKADIKTDAVDILRNVADVLASLTNHMQVEGHTDNIPIRTASYKSNWELSSIRSCEVLHFMVQEGGINPGNLTAAGYGEYHPLAPNDTKENRSRNRRVEILILNENADVKTSGK